MSRGGWSALPARTWAWRTAARWRLRWRPIRPATFIGMPECNVHLTQAVVYLSLAPKSNALYVAYEHGQGGRAGACWPSRCRWCIRNAPTRLMKELHYGEGYQYAHDTEDKLTDHAVPARLAAGTRTYYRAHRAGAWRAKFKARLEQIKDLEAAAWG